jgi:dGTPase
LEIFTFGPDALGDVTYAACLAHDIGNPPFGHIGEHAIQTWFKVTELTSVRKLMEAPEGKDFLYFDGNAQGFRCLTRLAAWRDNGGLQLTYATLAAFSKYPFGSDTANEKKKKFGFMKDDRDAAHKAFVNTGLTDGDSKYLRHPLAFIVEAADDICYLTTDIEDAFRMKIIPFSSAENLLKNIGAAGDFIPRYDAIRRQDEMDRIAYLRAGAVRSLIGAAISTFLDNRGPLLSGSVSLNDTLLHISNYKDMIKPIVELCKTEVYKETNKLQIEAAGYRIILDLMETFGSMIDHFVEGGEDKLNAREDGLFHLLPKEFRERLRERDPYRSFLVLTDYISGMTDRYILDLHHKLTGSSVTLGRMT